MGAASGVLRGAGWGARLGAMLGPPGAIGGAIAGAIIGGAIYYGGKAIVNQMKKADEEAEELNESAEEGACEECMSEEEQEERQRELEDDAGVEQRTKGKTKHGELPGGMDQADQDFDSLQPDGVRGINTKYGPGRTGELKNGNRITVRPGSSEGPPTLEIRRPNGRGTEIRYPNLGS